MFIAVVPVYQGTRYVACCVSVFFILSFLGPDFTIFSSPVYMNTYSYSRIGGEREERWNKRKEGALLLVDCRLCTY